MSIPAIRPHTLTYSFPSQRSEYRGAGADNRTAPKSGTNSELRSEYSTKQGPSARARQALPAPVGKQATSSVASSPEADPSRSGTPSESVLTQRSEGEKQLIEALKARDAEVRRHEQAHKSRAGSLAKGGARFDYQTGPDGRSYAIGGEVTLDVSKVPNDPEATIAKMEIVRSAALAPESPSSTDRAIAQKASQVIAEARQEIRSRSRQDQEGPYNPYALRPSENRSDPTISFLA